MNAIANGLLAFIACQIFWLNIQITLLRSDVQAPRSPQESGQ